MADEERLLGSDIAGSLRCNGVVAFARSVRKSGGEVQRKKITDGASGVDMEQDSRLTLLEYVYVLMLPRANVQAYKAAFEEGAEVTDIANGIDRPEYIAKFGVFGITKADWDAAIFEDNVVDLTVTVRSKGYAAAP